MSLPLSLILAARQFIRSLDSLVENLKINSTNRRKRENMKKTVSTALALAMAVLLATADIAAQSRIRFRRGSSSATVSGRIGVNRGVAGANYRSYVIRANGGQTISATLSSGNGKVAFAENDQTSFTIETDSTRDYELHIYNGGANNTSYTLTVSIQ
jgi:hypothetical protein